MRIYVDQSFVFGFLCFFFFFCLLDRMQMTIRIDIITSKLFNMIMRKWNIANDCAVCIFVARGNIRTGFKFSCKHFCLFNFENSIVVNLNTNAIILSRFTAFLGVAADFGDNPITVDCIHIWLALSFAPKEGEQCLVNATPENFFQIECIKNELIIKFMF